MIDRFINSLIIDKSHISGSHRWVIPIFILASFAFLISVISYSSLASTQYNSAFLETNKSSSIQLKRKSLFSLATFLPCKNPGWFPSEFGLKDHHSFWFDGYYYIVSIQFPGETRFAYSRSVDLCEWENLSPILSTRTIGTWDEFLVWSPFVYEEGGIFYLYYTGVTKEYTQSIMLATSTNPSDPNSWQIQSILFQPNHSNSLWQRGIWADCRDPSLIKVGNTYYLYYTGKDISGGIIGLATSTSITGPWVDWGGIVPPSSDMLESPTIIKFGDYFYLLYHLTGSASRGEYYRISDSPTGPWRQPVSLPLGWAHEVWKTPNGEWFTSFLTDDKISISPLFWDELFQPPLPIIGDTAYHLLLPLVSHQASP